MEDSKINNLELWNKVEKTNPNYTKKANVKGNQITSIAPQFQILNATEQFGVYGVTWGFRNIKLDYTLIPVCGMIYWSANFFFPNGEFPATNSISIWKDGAKTKPDDQFAKKVETDSLTKCLSKLGFNADIFLGKFDDVRYFNELKEEFGQEDPIFKTIKEAKSIDELKKIHLENKSLFTEGSKVLTVFNNRKKELTISVTPKPKVEKSTEQAHLELLISQIKHANNQEALRRIHKEEKKFHENKEFKKALNNRSIEIEEEGIRRIEHEKQKLLKEQNKI